MYNDHPRDPKIVAVVDRWSLFRGSFMLYTLILGPKNRDRYLQVVVSSGLTVLFGKTIIGEKYSFIGKILLVALLNISTMP